MVYGLEGREIYRNTLNQEVCREVSNNLCFTTIGDHPSHLIIISPANASTSAALVTFLLGCCMQAFLYSLEHKVPLVAFSQDRCFSMFKDPLVDSLHEVYHEPKV